MSSPITPHIHVVANDLPPGLSFPNGMVAIDTETTGLNVRSDKLCLCQVGDGQGNAWLIQFPQGYQAAPNLKALLTNPNIIKLFHFARFDIAILQHNLGVTVANYFCTKIASKLIHAAQPQPTEKPKHNLRGLVLKYCGVELDKTEQLSDWTVPTLSQSQQRYAANDVLYLHGIYTHMQPEITTLNLQPILTATLSYLAIRVAMDLQGFLDDDIFAHK